MNNKDVNITCGYWLSFSIMHPPSLSVVETIQSRVRVSPDLLLGSTMTIFYEDQTRQRKRRQPCNISVEIRNVARKED